MPLIIGLPGASKTSTSAATAKLIGVDVCDTNEWFRHFRKFPANQNGIDDPKAGVMNAYMDEVHLRFDHVTDMAHLEKVAQGEDEKHLKYQEATAEFLSHSLSLGDFIRAAARPSFYAPANQCMLWDSGFFRMIGEYPFRVFEIALLAEMNLRGYFRDALPDLSSSAPLYQENRDLFSPANGYETVLVDRDPDVMAESMTNDFFAYLKRSEDAGRDMPHRSDYERHARWALKDAGFNNPLSLDAGNPTIRAIVKDTLRNLSDKHRSDRMSHFEAMASRPTIIITNETPAEVAEMVVRPLRLG